MKHLYDTCDVVWIDHHITAINDSEKYGYNKMEGIRQIGTAAVELTWNYFFSNVTKPDIIQYLGAYDVWQKTRFSWDSIIVPVQLGLKIKYGLNYQTVWDDFGHLLTNPLDLEELIKTEYPEKAKLYEESANDFELTIEEKNSQEFLK